MVCVLCASSTPDAAGRSLLENHNEAAKPAKAALVQAALTALQRLKPRRRVRRRLVASVVQPAVVTDDDRGLRPSRRVGGRALGLVRAAKKDPVLALDAWLASEHPDLGGVAAALARKGFEAVDEEGEL